MKHRLYYALFALVVVASMVLAGCKPAAETPAPVVEPTAVPQPTEPVVEQPTEPPAPTFEGMKVEAENCDYGGEFKTIEAVDESTVKFVFPDATCL
jgi:hypothetical protein